MTKTLTEQWREGTLPEDCYYILTKNGHIKKERTCFYSHTDEQCFSFISNNDIEEVLAPVPSYQQLYGPNDGRIPVGLFTVLKLIKRDIERHQKIRHLTDLECGIKSQVVSLLKRWGWDLGKDELVSNSDELVQKIHILNEQNTKQYNELCEEIKKNNRLEKKLEIATKALNGIRDVWANNQSQFSYIARIANRKAKNALEEMEGVK